MSTNFTGTRKLWLTVMSMAMMLLFAALPQVAFAQTAPPAPAGVAINSSTTEDTQKILDTTILYDARFRIDIVSDPAHGSAVEGPKVVGSTFKIRYTPGADQTSAVSFSYRICESGTSPACSNAGAPATVTVTIVAVNDAPQATADTAVTNKNTPITINVKANDNAGPANEDQTLPLLSIAAAPTNGTAVVTADQKVLYTPTTGYCGTDVFTYLIQDSGGATAVGQVSVLVCPVVAAPKLKLSAPYAIANNTFKVDLILESASTDVSAINVDLVLGACIVDVDVPTNNGFAGNIEGDDPNVPGTDDVTTPLGNGFIFDAKDLLNTISAAGPNTVRFIAAGISAGGATPILAGTTQGSRTIASIQLKSGKSTCAGFPTTTLTLNNQSFTAPNGSPVTGTTANSTINLQTTINKKPTNIELVNTVPVKSNAAVNTYVGTLKTSDPDGDSSLTNIFTYTIVAQTPSVQFKLKNPPYNDEIEVSPGNPPVGTYVLTVETMDSYGGTFQKMINVVVTLFNQAPVAVTDSATVTSTTKINVIANDTDAPAANCPGCVVQSVTQGKRGIIVNNGLNVTYVLTDVNGAGKTDTFKYTVLDSDPTDPKTAIGTVNVTITSTVGLGPLGDCNNDKSIGAGDLTAIGLEYFDGDGLIWYNAYKGTYTKFNSYGCNSNKDKNIDAGDLTCTVRKIFNAGYICPTAVTAAASSSAALAVAGSVNGSRGNTVSVPVTLAARGNAVSGAAFVVNFDAATFDFAGVQFNTGNDLMNSVNATADGRVEIVLVDSSLAPSAFADGTIATINLTVKESATDGTSTISLSESSLGTVDGQSVSVAEENGSVQIGEQAEFNSFIYIPYIGR